ncbi:hypothetical protein OSTOST_08643 [Ostertagia ostertagi]
MSLIALALNLGIIFLYCYRYPVHPSLRPIGDPATLVLQPSAEGGSKEGDKEKKDVKERKTKSAEGKKSKKPDKKKKGKQSKEPIKTDSKETPVQEPSGGAKGSSNDDQPGAHAEEQNKPSNEVVADPTQPAKQQSSEKKEGSNKEQKQAEDARNEPEKENQS